MAETWVMPTHIVACAGVVLNDKEEVLMVKTHNAGWVFPGGQVEVGENLIDAVKREIREESGIEVEVGGKLSASDETSESGWFSKEKALEMIIAPAYIERYKAFLEYNGRTTYMEYVTKPTFEMKLKRSI